LWAFCAGFVAWWLGALVLVAAGILVANFIQQVAAFGNHAILTKGWQLGLVVLAVIWFSAAMSLIRLRVTQNYVNVQFFFYGAAIFLIGLAGVVWLLKGHPASNSFAAAEWNPFRKDLGNAALGIPYNLTFFSFAILALLGIETPMNMGVEVRGGERAIRTYLVWGSIIVVVVYFIYGAGTSDPYKYFYALYAGLTIVWCISTALLFLDVFFAKRANPVKFEEARRAPMWVLYTSGAVGTVANIFAVFFIFTGTWYPPGWPKLSQWNYWMIAITGVSILAGITIYLVSQQSRRGKSDAELL